jgi:hypothetical protein
MTRTEFLKTLLSGTAGLLAARDISVVSAAPTTPEPAFGEFDKDDERLSIVQLLDGNLRGYPHYRTPETDALITHGAECTLVPEPKNPHDKFAVAVYREGIKIGYLPKETNQTVHVLLRIGKKLDAVILLPDPAEDDWRDNPWQFIWLAVCLFEELPPGVEPPEWDSDEA